MPMMQRPTRVNQALALLWAAMAIGGLSVGASLPELWGESFFVFMMVVTVALFAANALLIWLIGRRRNWARIVMLVVIVIMIPFMFVGDAPDDTVGFVAVLAEWLSLVLELIAMYLLFSRDGAIWFRQSTGEAIDAL